MSDIKPMNGKNNVKKGNKKQKQQQQEPSEEKDESAVSPSSTLVEPGSDSATTATSVSTTSSESTRMEIATPTATSSSFSVESKEDIKSHEEKSQGESVNAQIEEDGALPQKIAVSGEAGEDFAQQMDTLAVPTKSQIRGEKLAAALERNKAEVEHLQGNHPDGMFPSNAAERTHNQVVGLVRGLVIGTAFSPQATLAFGSVIGAATILSVVGGSAVGAAVGLEASQVIKQTVDEAIQRELQKFLVRPRGAHLTEEETRERRRIEVNSHLPQAARDTIDQAANFAANTEEFTELWKRADEIAHEKWIIPGTLATRWHRWFPVAELAILGAYTGIGAMAFLKAKRK